MLPAVQNPSQSPSSKASTRLSDEGRVKALAMLGTLRTLADDEPLIPVESCQRVIATMTDDLQPCSPTDAQAFVALLLTAYPSIRQAIDDRDWRHYNHRLAEAFQQFSPAICRVIVHGGTGVPAKQRYKPQPSDIVECGNAELARIQNAKTMAQRHLLERQRRDTAAAERAAFDASLPTVEQRREQVARLLGGTAQRMGAG